MSQQGIDAEGTPWKGMRVPLRLEEAARGRRRLCGAKDEDTQGRVSKRGLENPLITMRFRAGGFK